MIFKSGARAAASAVYAAALFPGRSSRPRGSGDIGVWLGIDVLLSPLTRLETALLQVNCALRKVPAEHQTEGIRLASEGGGGEFDRELRGRTLFVLTRPAASGATKPPPPRVNPKRTPPQ